jgi:hypothetical protein
MGRVESVDDENRAQGSLQDRIGSGIVAHDVVHSGRWRGGGIRAIRQGGKREEGGLERRSI